MAGKRQHYIPQALQKGFANTHKQLFRCSPDRTVPVNITKVGLERNFYGEEDCPVDTIITDFEGRTAAILDEMRLTKTISDIKNLTRFVYLTSIRTKNFRTATDSLTNDTFQALGAAMDLINPCELYCSIIENDPLLIAESCKEELLRQGYSEADPRFRVALWRFTYFILINGKTFVNSTQNNIIQQYSSLSARFKEGTENMGKSIQKKVIPDIIDNDPELLQFLHSLNWSVIEYSNDLILGDCPVIFYKNSSNYGCFFISKNDVEAVIMPISKRQAVFGSKGCTKINSELLNIMSASVSLHYYLAYNEQDERYAHFIGSRNGIEPDINVKSEAFSAFITRLNKMIR